MSARTPPCLYGGEGDDIIVTNRFRVSAPAASPAETAPGLFFWAAGARCALQHLGSPFWRALQSLLQIGVIDLMLTSLLNSTGLLSSAYQCSDWSCNCTCAVCCSA